MARIVSVGTAVPPHRITQEDARQLTRRLFDGAITGIDTLITVFDHAQIDTRYSAAPLDWFTQPRPFSEKNALYVSSAHDLASEAILRCLEPTGLSPSDIDHLIFVSTTGIATPSIDARLVHHLKMNPHVRRTPIWGLGCAGGVAGLSRAADFARAKPESRIIIVAVELCTLTFLLNDHSRSNLIATSLFGDGAAAVLVTGEHTEWTGPMIIGETSVTWPDSLDVMGWEVVEDGLKVVISKEIPAIVGRHIRPLMEDFLAHYGLTTQDVRHYITHPGGPRVIDGYKEALGLEEMQVSHPRSVLKEYGNMSSPTVLFILKRFLDQLRDSRNEYGIASAMGPGFSAEMVLLKW